MRKLGSVVLVLFLLWLAATVIARVIYTRERDQGWAIANGSLQNVRDHFPATHTNSSAERLEELAAALGIDLVPRTEAPRRARGEFDFKPTDILLKDYTSTQVEQSEIKAPPPPLAEFLDKHQTQIRQVQEHLKTAPTAAWTSDVTRGFDAPLPNLLGHMQLHRTLIGAALNEVTRRDFGAAWSLLEASSRLSASLLDRPELLSQLIRLSEMRLLDGAMRLVPGAAPPWALAQPPADTSDRVLLALAVDAYMIDVYIEESGIFGLFTTLVHKEPNFVQGVFSVVAGPYILYSASKTLAAYKATINPLLGDHCATRSPPRQEFANWNYLGKIFFSGENFGTVWKRLHERFVHAAGTRLILQIKSGAPDDHPIRCSDGWVTTRQADGSTLIRYTRDLGVRSERADIPRLPLQYVIQRGR